MPWSSTSTSSPPPAGRAATRLQSTAARWSSSYSRSSTRPRRPSPDLHDARAHRRHLADQGGPQTSDLQRQRHGHPGPGDGGAAGPAVGVQHIAVHRERALAQGRQVDGLAQAPADEPLDLHRAALLLAPGGLAVRPGVRGRGQHAVFGGEPARCPAPSSSPAPCPPGWPSTAHGCAPASPGRIRPHGAGRRFQIPGFEDSSLRRISTPSLRSCPRALGGVPLQKVFPGTISGNIPP